MFVSPGVEQIDLLVKNQMQTVKQVFENLLHVRTVLQSEFP